MQRGQLNRFELMLVRSRAVPDDELTTIGELDEEGTALRTCRSPGRGAWNDSGRLPRS